MAKISASEDNEKQEFEELIAIVKQAVGVDEHAKAKLLESIGSQKKRGTHEIIFSRVFALLSAGDSRQVWRVETGIKGKKTIDREVDAIVATIGADKWKELLGIFYALPSEFQNKVRRPGEIAASERRQVRYCRKLADALEQHNPFTLRQDIHSSPFSGLIARELLRESGFGKSLVNVLEVLPRAYKPAIAIEMIKQCIFGLWLADPTPVLVRTLRAFADAIEKGKMDPATAAMLFPQFTQGKLNVKEFTKRVVFFLLEHNWPETSRRPPNKETALVVNVILGLRGKRAVTANDISQMNKKTRRRYYKDAAQVIGRIRAAK